MLQGFNCLHKAATGRSGLKNILGFKKVMAVKNRMASKGWEWGLIKRAPPGASFCADSLYLALSSDSAAFNRRCTSRYRRPAKLSLAPAAAGSCSARRRRAWQAACPCRTPRCQAARKPLLRNPGLDAKWWDSFFWKSESALRGPTKLEPRNKVKAGKECSGEVDVLHRRLVRVVSPVDRVGCRQDGRPAVQGGGDPCLCDADGLLLHDFVDSSSVPLIHFVKLIDAAHPHISHDQCTTFQSDVAGGIVPVHAGRQSCGAGALARGVHGARSDVGHLSDGKMTAGTGM